MDLTMVNHKDLTMSLAVSLAMYFTIDLTMDVTMDLTMVNYGEPWLTMVNHGFSHRFIRGFKHGLNHG